MKKAEVGFEPTNHGFAIRSLSPLGYSAKRQVAGYFDLIMLAHKLRSNLFEKKLNITLKGESICYISRAVTKS